jgi:hypothetical protein
MKIIQVINSVADLVIAISLIFFLYFVNRDKGKMKKVNLFEAISVRIALSLGAAGSLYDALTVGTEASFLVHVSFAMVFIWGAHFHYKYFIKGK